MTASPHHGSARTCTSVNRKRIIEITESRTPRRPSGRGGLAVLNSPALPERFVDPDWRSRCLISLIEIEHEPFHKETIETILKALAKSAKEKRRGKLAIVRNEEGK